jgi:hypothetical protein
MATANPAQTSAPAASRASTSVNSGDGHLHGGSMLSNGHNHHGPATGTSASGTGSKKAKGKKATDPNEASKLIAAKIEQLELDADKEKDQEAEIGAS